MNVCHTCDAAQMRVHSNSNCHKTYGRIECRQTVNKGQLVFLYEWAAMDAIVSAINRSRLSNVSCCLVVGGGGIDSTVYEFSSFIYLFSEKIVCLRLFFTQKKKKWKRKEKNKIYER